MYKRQLLASIMWLAISSCSEKEDATATTAPSFSALIVSDMDRSSAWYQSVLGLTVTQEINDASGRILILSRQDFQMELLRLNGSVGKAEALSGQPAGTQIQGLFKMGFKVDNFNSWQAHLTSLQMTPQLFTDTQTGKRNLLVNDPDGNIIQFFE